MLSAKELACQGILPSSRKDPELGVALGEWSAQFESSD